MFKKVNGILSLLSLVLFQSSATETITYQQGTNNYSGAIATAFSSSRYQNSNREAYYFRYDGANRHYNIEYFDLGDLLQEKNVTSAHLVFYRVGGTIYKQSDIYVRQILDPDNLGTDYRSGWKKATGFRAGANNESRDDSTSVDVKWRLSDPDSPDDLNRDYFQGVLNELNRSPYFSPLKEDAIGTEYQVDVTNDLQCIQQGLCVNQGWALFHEDPDANMQYIIASSDHEQIVYRPTLVVTFDGDNNAPTLKQANQQTIVNDNSTKSYLISIETDEAATCKIDNFDGTQFNNMSTLMPSNTNKNIHSYSYTSTNSPQQLHVRCKDQSENISQILHSFIFSAFSGGDTGGDTGGGTGGDSSGDTGGDSSGGTGGDSSTSNFTTSKEVITPNFGETAPAIGETIIDSKTGASITRLAGNGLEDELIVYSRYSPENSAGDLILTFGANSTSSKVIDRKSGELISQLTDNKGKTIGEYHEIRWDTSGNFPYRVYFIQGMSFWKIEDVRNPNSNLVLIRDFSSEFPNSSKIYNDVEGDSSNDSDHWAWMAVHYGEQSNGSSTYLVDAFIHYQVSTDTLHSMVPSDLANSNLAIEAENAANAPVPIFNSRPNMIEMSPLGTGVVIHTRRAWDDSAYGGNGKDYIGTWFDGAHLWPVDFDFNRQTPVKISISETHSGWAFDDTGKEIFISQNNRTDRLDAIYINGDSSGYDNRIEVASHADLGWNNNFHYGKMPQHRPGWLFMSSYSTRNDEWAENQFMMIQTKPEEENPIIWRISPSYNAYDGDYRDEAPAAINLQGNRIYWSSNWGDTTQKRSVYVIELPDDWDTKILE